jgi:membrane protease YdiL (CAAX protease family)
MELLILLGLGLLGLLGWRWLSPGLRALRTEDTLPFGGRFAVVVIVWQFALLFVIPRVSERLLDQLLLQAGISLLAIAFAWLMFLRGRDGARELGLRLPAGPPTVLVAVAAYLAFLPVLAAAGYVNQLVHRLLGAEEALQLPLEQFLADPALQRSAVAWICIVLVLPTCEELVFRSALYAGLRRALHPALAVGLSATLFGAVHEPSAMLPAAALGAALAVLYERTGSLAAPIAFHALHNGLTLFVAAHAPEMLT